MKNIVLIGCGGFGIVHFESLLRGRYKANIFVADKLQASLKNAENIYNNFSNNTNKVYFTKSIDDLPKKLDIVIVATNSKNRPFVIDSISKKNDVKFWILEKVISQSKEGLLLITKNVNNLEKTWVNYARRTMDFHNSLYNVFIDQGDLEMEVYGGLWNLATNSPHFIDLVSFWTGEHIININNSLLEKNWFKSQRDDFFEINGKLEIKFNNGSRLILICENKYSDLNIKVKNKFDEWDIIEFSKLKSNNLGWVSFASSKKGREINGFFDKQLITTKNVVENILINGQCKLPTLRDTIINHERYIEAMMLHWNQTNNLRDSNVPIT